MSAQFKLCAAMLIVGSSPHGRVANAAGDDADYCGKGSTLTLSPGSLDPSTGNRDTAVDTVTICNGEGISSSGSLVAIDYFAVDAGTTTCLLYTSPSPRD